MSWRPACSLGYTCTTEEEYLARSEGTCNDYIFFSLSQPTPDSVCVPVDGGCQWHNPCTTWLDHCNTNYRCGSQADLARFNASPFVPQCAVPGTPGTHTHCHRAMRFDSDSTKHGILIGEQIVKSRSIHEKIHRVDHLRDHSHWPSRYKQSPSGTGLGLRGFGAASSKMCISRTLLPTTNSARRV